MSDITDSVIVFGVGPVEEQKGPVASEDLIAGQPQHSVELLQ